uniref:Uncharacterized protein n=1 Tax=Arundo donax TaxID=35708 RepID=A0A0A9B931_ARUDO
MSARMEPNLPWQDSFAGASTCIRIPTSMTMVRKKAMSAVTRPQTPSCWPRAPVLSGRRRCAACVFASLPPPI